MRPLPERYALLPRRTAILMRWVAALTVLVLVGGPLAYGLAHRLDAPHTYSDR